MTGIDLRMLQYAYVNTLIGCVCFRVRFEISVMLALIQMQLLYKIFRKDFSMSVEMVKGKNWKLKARRARQNSRWKERFVAPHNRPCGAGLLH